MSRTLPIRLRTLAAAVVVIATGLIIWNAYQSIINTTDPTPQTLPIIAADKEPFRVLPDDPGGVEIPNKGSRLFNVLNAENADDLALSGVKIDREEEEAETILPTTDNTNGGFELPEIPEPRRESLYDELGTLKDRKVIEEEPNLEVISQDDKQDLKQKLEQAIEKAVEEEKIEERQKEVADVPSAVPVPSLKPSPPVKKKSIAPAPKEQPKKFSLDRILSQEPQQKSYYIQLASLKSEADARAAYARIRDNFPALVKGVSVVFPKADLGARGTFYRIQVGPLSQSEAQKRCQNYTAAARGGTCLVISR